MANCTFVSIIVLLCAVFVVHPALGHGQTDVSAEADRYGRYDWNLFILTEAPASAAVDALGYTFQARKNDIVNNVARFITEHHDPHAVQEELARHLVNAGDEVWADTFSRDLVATLEPKGIDTSALRLRASRAYREDAFLATRERARELVADGSYLVHLHLEEGDPRLAVDELTTRASHFRGQTLRVLERGEFAFTFDDGPHVGGRTTRVLDALREHGYEATFFQLGSAISSAPAAQALQRRIVDEGHDVGVHGWYHATKDGRPYPRMDSAAIRRDLTRARDVLQETYGFAPITFRAPYGEFRSSDFDILEDLGLTYVGWDIDTNDWRQQTPSELAAETLRLMERRGSGIVLMHDVQERTSRAIGEILREVNRRGYQVVNLRHRLTGSTIDDRDEARHQPDEPIIPTPPIREAQRGEVTASALNVRSGPSTDFDVMGRLSQGARVSIIERVDDWYRIDYQGRDGYVSGSFVRLVR